MELSLLPSAWRTGVCLTKAIGLTSDEFDDTMLLFLFFLTITTITYMLDLRNRNDLGVGGGWRERENRK